MPERIIDLTHLLNNRMPVYPGTAPPVFTAAGTVAANGYKETLLGMLSHTGTHIDAPSHILENGRSLDQFPPDQFTGRAMLIPCQERQEIGMDLLLAYEPLIAAVDFLLFFTGWQFRWGTDAYFESCPVPNREAALWLTRFHLKGIGVDAFSLDRISDASGLEKENYPNHHIFLQHEILLIENLTNLDQLPPGDFFFQCFPLKLEDADGSPVRAVATAGDQLL